jgi:hypothetical protein
MGIKTVELCVGDAINSTNWEKIYNQKVDDADGELQRLNPDIPANVKTGFLRIRITSGWSDICSVFKVSVTGAASAIGNPLEGRNSTAAYQGAGSLSSRLSATGGVDTYNGSPSSLSSPTASRHKQHK